MPDGSEVLFHLGSLLEHSCEPNVKLYIYRAADAPAYRGVRDLPNSTLIGEWRVTHAVSMGEVLCTSYLENEVLVCNRCTRQQKLKTRNPFND